MKYGFFRRISQPVTLLKTVGEDRILQNAKLRFVDKPKPSNKHQAKFEKMLGMDYSCPGIGDIQLMVGVRKRDKTKIQYCITAITPTLRKKKGSHK